MIFRKVASSFLVSLALVGCAGMGKPSITASEPSVTGVSAKGLELGMSLKIDNPNPIPMVASEVKGTLLLEGKKVGTASVELDESIASKGSSTVQSKLVIAWSSASALTKFIGKSSVPFRFEGKLAVSGGPLKMSVPFVLKGEMTRAQLAGVGAASLSNLSGLLGN